MPETREPGPHDLSGPVLLACTGRVAGYGFDPLTLAWFHDASGATSAVLATVRNTYGGLHHYLVHPDRSGRATVDKDFHVSPFHDSSGHYTLSVPDPGESVDVAVVLHRDDAPPLRTSVRGEARAVGTGTVLGLALRRPLEPLAVSARIRVHGIRLWLRGLRIHPVPDADTADGRPDLVAPTEAGTPLVTHVAGHGPVAHGSTAHDPVSGATTATDSGPSRHAPAPDPSEEGPRRSGVPPVPHGPRATAFGLGFRALFALAVRRLPVRVELPDGTLLGGRARDRSAPTMVVHRPRDFANRVGAGASIGFGEAFMAGDWSSPDPAALLTEFARDLAGLVPAPLQRLRDVYIPRPPAHEHGAVERTRDNVSAHYDLSNELFALFLDDTMTYSSALFPDLPLRRGGAADDPAPSSSRELEPAQRAKIDALLDAAGVGPGSRVLEIGTGWGELCVRAAARGATVRSVTLSSEQRHLALERVRAAGLQDSVEIDLLDYRHVTGTYDAVVSVEMIEAVGLEYLGEYFRTIDSVLAPGGRVAIQAILMDDHRVRTTRRNYTWVHKYVFPGGRIPSVEAIDRAVAGTALRRTTTTSMGLHYAETLREWDRRFAARHDEVRALGFDEVFLRMWRFYLTYCEAGFRAGYLDVAQLTMEKTR